MRMQSRRKLGQARQSLTEVFIEIDIPQLRAAELKESDGFKVGWNESAESGKLITKAKRKVFVL